MIRICLLLFLLVSSSFIHAQNEINNWFVGSGFGIKFPGPTIDNTYINGSQVVETSSSISNKDGELLFYTNGRTIWDATHAVMVGGNNLEGGPSSTQGCYIVRQPGSQNIYYVFTTMEGDMPNPENGPGFRYTVVDMDLQGNGTANDPKGEVVDAQKNTELFAPCTEKIAITPVGCNGIWVVGHGWNNNNFHAFKFTNNGIETGPVSAAGSVLGGINSDGGYRGNLIFRKNGTELIQTGEKNVYVEIFDFNNVTGEVTGPKITIAKPAAANQYAVGLSPNERFLYVTCRSGHIYQYDLDAADPKTTEYLVTQGPGMTCRPKLGPDQKLYIPRDGTNHLCVINAPDNAGQACNFVENGVDLGGGNRINRGSLPEMFDPGDVDGVIIDSIVPVHLNCTNKGAFEIFISGGEPPYEISVNGGPFTNNTKYEDLDAGTYEIEIRDKNGCTASGSIEIEQSIDNPKIEFETVDVTCDIKGQFKIIISGGAKPYEISVDGGPFSTDSVYKDLDEGTYEVTVKDKNGCSSTSTVEIKKGGNGPKIEFEVTDVICDIKGQFKVIVSGGLKPFEISVDGGPFTTDSIYTNLDEGTYEVTVRDKNGCSSVSTVEIKRLTEGIEIKIDPVDDLCLSGDPVKLKANYQGGRWTGNGMQNDVFNPKLAGIGSHTITYSIDGDCGGSGSIVINVVDAPPLEITADKKIGCSPLNVNFNYAGSSNLVNCQWDLGNGTTSNNCKEVNTTYTEVGCYDVSFSAQIPQGCKSTVQEKNIVCVVADPIAEFSSTPTEVSPGDPLVNFTNLSIGDSLLYQWTFPNGSTSSETHPSHNFNYPEGTYSVCLKSSSIYGCKDSICHDIKVKGEFFIYVPNAFTPNGDGINDSFFPIIYGHDENSYSLKIFNRWGERVFESKNLNQGWMGKIGSPQDQSDKKDINKFSQSIYVWKIKVAEKSTGKWHKLIGHVSLLK